MPDAIVLDGLQKRYGTTTALDSLDLVVPEGSVTGLLGPNGAGKTTAIRILSTLLRPDGGRVTVFGADVVRQAPQVRASIGLTGQFSAVDEILTGVENLTLIGRLHRMGAREARGRADDLLAAFDLAEAAGRRVKTYSGGMRRRLDLAASLMARPRLLMLDEPTTGLDSRSRTALWEVIEQLRRTGTTVLLTTQYLEEADRLSDTVAVIDHGRLVAQGTPDELKSRVGGERLELVLADAGQLDAASQVLERATGRIPAADRDRVAVSVDVGADGLDRLADVLAELRTSAVRVVDVAVRRPTLDTVFLRLTGQPATAATGPDTPEPTPAELDGRSPVGAGRTGSKER